MRGIWSLLDDSLSEPGIEDLSFGGHGEDDRESELVGSRVERTELFTERGRKHRNRSLNEVDGGRTLASFTIERSVGL